MALNTIWKGSLRKAIITEVKGKTRVNTWGEIGAQEKRGFKPRKSIFKQNTKNGGRRERERHLRKASVFRRDKFTRKTEGLETEIK